MKKNIIFSMLLFLSCNQQPENIEKKFNTLKNLDYSEFVNMSFAIRGGNYYVTYKEQQLRVEYNFLTKRIHIEKAFSKDKDITLSNNDIETIRRVVIAFSKMKIFSLGVDAKGNVYVSIFWNDYCTYHFLKLSPNNSLEEIKKQYYQPYKEDWYLDEECSGR